MSTKKFLTTFLILSAITFSVNAQYPMQAMSKYAGKWKAQYIMWMSPGDAPMYDSLKANSEMMMNDLFMSTYYTGKVMGAPFEAVCVIGYNLGSGNYELSWFDNSSSSIDYTTGKASADGKTIEMKGTTFDPALKKELTARRVITFTDDTHQKMELFISDGKRENKTIEIDLVKE